MDVRWLDRWHTSGRWAHIYQNRYNQRLASYATICQCIADVWTKVSVSTVVRAFTKVRIINEQPSNSKEAESDDDERDPGLLDAAIAQLWNSDTEDEFVEEKQLKSLCFFVLQVNNIDSYGSVE